MCRGNILSMLGLNGDEDTINEAKKRLDDHLDGKFINADLRFAVNFYCLHF